MTNGKILVTKVKTLVTKGKTSVTKGNTLVSKGKNVWIKRGEVPKLPAPQGLGGLNGPIGPFKLSFLILTFLFSLLDCFVATGWQSCLSFSDIFHLILSLIYEDSRHY